MLEAATERPALEAPRPRGAGGRRARSAYPGQRHGAGPRGRSLRGRLRLAPGLAIAGSAGSSRTAGSRWRRWALPHEATSRGAARFDDVAARVPAVARGRDRRRAAGPAGRRRCGLDRRLRLRPGGGGGAAVVLARAGVAGRCRSSRSAAAARRPSSPSTRRLGPGEERRVGAGAPRRPPGGLRKERLPLLDPHPTVAAPRSAASTRPATSSGRWRLPPGRSKRGRCARSCSPARSWSARRRPRPGSDLRRPARAVPRLLLLLLRHARGRFPRRQPRAAGAACGGGSLDRRPRRLHPPQLRPGRRRPPRRAAAAQREEPPRAADRLPSESSAPCARTRSGCRPPRSRS